MATKSVKSLVRILSSVRKLPLVWPDVISSKEPESIQRSAPSLLYGINAAVAEQNKLLNCRAEVSAERSMAQANNNN